LEDLRKTNPKIPNLYNVLLSYQITKVSTDYDMKYSTNWNFNGNIGNDFDIHLFDLNDTGKINIAYDYNSSKYSDEDIVSGRIDYADCSQDSEAFFEQGLSESIKSMLYDKKKNKIIP
jgi:hypothetical protein